MGWYYRINRDCDLASLGLSFDGSNATVSGRTPVYDDDSPILSVECDVEVFQDIVRGVVTYSEMNVEVQALSYGLKRLTFALTDANTQPLGQSRFDLQSDPTLAFQSFSLSCMPHVTWLSLASNGTLSYSNSAFETGGVSPEQVDSFDEVQGDSARCTLTAVRQVTAQSQIGPVDENNANLPPQPTSEVTLEFEVQRVWIWSGMRYIEDEIVVRKRRAIVPRKLARVPPNGFSVYKAVGWEG